MANISRNMPGLALRWLCELSHVSLLTYFFKIKQRLLTQEVRNTRIRLVFLPTLLSCSRRFLRALKQNRAQSRLLYLLNKIQELCFSIGPYLCEVT